MAITKTESGGSKLFRLRGIFGKIATVVFVIVLSFSLQHNAMPGAPEVEPDKIVAAILQGVNNDGEHYIYLYPSECSTDIDWGYMNIIYDDACVTTTTNLAGDYPSDENFLGYYSMRNGGIQYIDANGHITAAGIARMQEEPWISDWIIDDDGEIVEPETETWYPRYQRKIVCDHGGLSGTVIEGEETFNIDSSDIYVFRDAELDCSYNDVISDVCDVLLTEHEGLWVQFFDDGSVGLTNGNDISPGWNFEQWLQEAGHSSYDPASPIPLLCNTGCSSGYYLQDGTCVDVGVGYYSPTGDGSRYACTNAPANATYTGSGGDTDSCPWSCDAGYYKSGNVCNACTSVTFNNQCTVTNGTGTQTCYRETGPTGATSATQCMGVQNCGTCNVASCNSGYTNYSNACHGTCSVMSTLHAGEYEYGVFADKTNVSSPVLHLKKDDTTCYVYLGTDTGAGGLKLQHNNTTYTPVFGTKTCRAGASCTTDSDCGDNAICRLDYGTCLCNATPCQDGVPCSSDSDCGYNAFSGTPGVCLNFYSGGSHDAFISPTATKLKAPPSKHYICSCPASGCDSP